MKPSLVFKKIFSKDSIDVIEDGIVNMVEASMEIASGDIEKGIPHLIESALNMGAKENHIIFEMDQVVISGDAAKVLPQAIPVH